MQPLNRLLLFCAAVLPILASGCFLHPSIPKGGTRSSTAVEAPDPTTIPYTASTNLTEGRVGQDLYGFPSYSSTSGTVNGVFFASDRHSREMKIYHRGLEGRTVRRLTYGPGNDLHPSVSPDGKKLAFASDRTGSWQIYLASTTDAKELTSIEVSGIDCVHPCWSPSGDRLLYSRQSPVTGEWEVWVYEFSGGQHAYLTDGLFADWHPGGNRIAFQRHRRRDREYYSIWTREMSNGLEREVVSGKDWAAVNPCWSPDGTKIAFNSVGRAKTAEKNSGSGRGADTPAPEPLDSGDDIYVVGSDGNDLTRLTFRPGPEWNPHWGRDGRIYFNATRSAKTAIWSLEL